MESKIQDCAKQLSSTFKIKDDISKIEDILKTFFLTSASSSTTTNNNTGCTSVIKSGERKGKPCGLQCVAGKTTCKRHSTSDEKEESKTTVKTTTKSEVKTDSKKEPATKKTISAQTKESPSVFKKIEQNIKTFNVMRNAFGNYEHKETGFIFDTTKTQTVVGKQHSDGTISPLSLNDIELCKENNWNFEIPLKLSTASEPKDKSVKRNLVTVVDDDDDEDEYDEEDEN
jgi:hypothetical protein